MKSKIISVLTIAMLAVNAGTASAAVFSGNPGNDNSIVRSSGDFTSAADTVRRERGDRRRRGHEGHGLAGSNESLATTVGASGDRPDETADVMKSSSKSSSSKSSSSKSSSSKSSSSKSSSSKKSTSKAS